MVVLQQQLKQLSLHIKETGVMDKDTEAVIKAIRPAAALVRMASSAPRPSTACWRSTKFGQAGCTGRRRGRNQRQRRSHARRSQAGGRVHVQPHARQERRRQPDARARKDMEQFLANWDKNKGAIREVSETSRHPAKLVAALHWRESTGDLAPICTRAIRWAKKAVHEPADIPIFKTWEPAAEHALGMKNPTQKAYKIDAHTTDEAALTSYAERYNGLGYHNYHAQASPYVFAGTDQYKKASTSAMATGMATTRTRSWECCR